VSEPDEVQIHVPDESELPGEYRQCFPDAVVQPAIRLRWQTRANSKP